MHTLRTRFKKDIVAEFLPPYAGIQTRKTSRNVIILASGMPGSPFKKEVMEYLSGRGYWVFNPRYRGTWESGGKFLKKSPHLDIKDVMDELPNGFTELWSGKKMKVKPSEIMLIGSSFGGPAVLLNSHDERVKKVVCFSPVVDWTAPFPEEPLNWLQRFTRQAFGEAYRFRNKDWQKQGQGSFYNPAKQIKRIDGSKIYIIHAQDDDVVVAGPVEGFAKQVRCKITVLPEGGHLGMSALLADAGIARRVGRFLKG